MPATATQLDLSPLPPALRREVQDFYEFLLSRGNKALQTVSDHEQWVIKQVEAAVKSADDPTTELIAHEMVKSRWTDKKSCLLASAAQEKRS